MIMKRPIQSLIQAVMLILFMAAGGLLLAAPPSGESDPEVDSASPNFALQGERKTVTISGKYFAPGFTVRFLVEGTKDSSQIDVISAVYMDDKTIEADIQVLGTATVSNYDIEVKVGRRKGKGTTFRVDKAADVSPSECNFDFDAEFCDTRLDAEGNCTACEYIDPSDSSSCITETQCDALGNSCERTQRTGLRSDGKTATDGPYPAIGGMGFRLDTNGSMKLETDRDERKIVVDFDAHSLCPTINDPDPDHPATAAGFCINMKGSDMRIEHQVQDPYGLCVLQPGESVDQGFVVSFQADDGGTLIDPNRNGKGPEPLRLNYGCRGNQTGSDYYERGWEATVTRHSKWEWSIVGWTACLETQLGKIWGVDSTGDLPIEIHMPFRIDITRVDAPAQ
jgi:hypothetical protein